MHNRTEDMIADFLTKGLARYCHEDLTKSMGLRFRMKGKVLEINRLSLQNYLTGTVNC